jgi:hypothetical protein
MLEIMWIKHPINSWIARENGEMARHDNLCSALALLRSYQNNQAGIYY